WWRRCSRGSGPRSRLQTMYGQLLRTGLKQILSVSGTWPGSLSLSCSCAANRSPPPVYITAAPAAKVCRKDLEASSLPELTGELRRQAAVFVAQDEGPPGFLSRFADAVITDTGLASRALDQALTASARAGNASVQLWPGDLRVVATSTG